MKISLAFLLLLTTISHAAEVYVSRDANGNMVFSDKPHANAQVHEVKELPSVPAVTAPSLLQQPAAASEPAFNYTSLAIIAPANGQTIPPGHAANIEISGVLSPGLRESDEIFLIINNSVVRQGRQTTFHLTDLPRGEHRMQMRVQDKDGKQLIASNPVTIHVQRPSVLHRAPK